MSESKFAEGVTPPTRKETLEQIAGFVAAACDAAEQLSPFEAKLVKSDLEGLLMRLNMLQNVNPSGLS